MEENIIDICGQDFYDKEGFVTALKDLREMIFQAFSSADNLDYEANKFCKNIAILNWLIEDVTIVDKYE